MGLSKRKSGMAGWLILFVASAGCDKLGLSDVKDTVSNATKQAQRAVGQATDRVNEAAGRVGGFQLQIDDALDVPACFVKLQTFQSDRPALLQITSYRDPGRERYPAVLMHAQLSAEALEDLVGQTVEAATFVMGGDSGPLWHSPAGLYSEIEITEVTETDVLGTIHGGTLVNPATGEEIDLTGTFTAKRS